MRPWKSVVQMERGRVRLLVRDDEHQDVVKGVLNPRPQHPRALLTLLEGIALWSGHRLPAVICAASDCLHWPGSGLFGDEQWPGQSQLVEWEVALPARRRVRLDGLGSFRVARRGLE
jgi:hypothetical protein